MEAKDLRFREEPDVDIHFTGTPDFDSTTSSRRRNLPDRVAADVDYHDVRVDYRLANRLRDGDEDETPEH